MRAPGQSRGAQTSRLFYPDRLIGATAIVLVSLVGRPAQAHRGHRQDGRPDSQGVGPAGAGWLKLARTPGMPSMGKKLRNPARTRLCGPARPWGPSLTTLGFLAEESR